MYPIDNETLDWVEFLGYNSNMPRPSHLREESVFNVDGRRIAFERNSPLEGTRAEWTLDAQLGVVLESRAQQTFRAAD